MLNTKKNVLSVHPCLKETDLKNLKSLRLLHCPYIYFCRHLINQGEILNCDLTDQTSSTLDRYNTQHLIVNAVTDFYDRIVDIEDDDEECSNVQKKHLERPLKAPQRPSLIRPQTGNDHLSSTRLQTLEASGWEVCKTL